MGQAVGVNGKAGTVDPIEQVSAAYSVDAINGIITFDLTNIFNVLDSGFTLAWEMTCANDVIYASVEAGPRAATCPERRFLPRLC